MQDSRSIGYEWVAGKYYGDDAKHVSSLASNGVGYYRLSSGTDGGGSFVIMAFTRPLTGPRPHHLTEIVDPTKVAELEKKRTPNQQDNKRGVRTSS